jgi:hypothetical protein
MSRLFLSRNIEDGNGRAGHEDEISCMALHPDLDTVATGGTGRVPKIQIWSAATMKGPASLGGQKHELEMMAGDQYVLVMAFSPCGRLLLTVSANEEHTIRIWDWKEKKVVENAESKGNKGTAPQVFGAVWNKYRPQWPLFDGAKDAEKKFAQASEALERAREDGDEDAEAEAAATLETAAAEKALQDDIKAKHPTQWGLREAALEAEAAAAAAAKALAEAQVSAGRW